MSEKARNLVWVMEKMKNRREGKKIGTLKMMKKKEEEMEKKVEEGRRGREEEKKQKEEALQRNRELEERLCRMQKEMEEMKMNEEVLHTPALSNTPHMTPFESAVTQSGQK